MKTQPRRSDILVLGGGMAGISSAIAASKSGATVQLVDTLPCLGGNVSEGFQHPLDLPYSTNNPFFRESGIWEEITNRIREDNTEGTFTGQSRALFSLIKEYKTISVALGYHCLETNLNTSQDRIESCLLANLDKGEKFLHRSEYYIDCSEFAELSQTAKAPGEHLSSINPGNREDTARKFKLHTLIEIGEKNDPIDFKCPDWIETQWEENALSARISLMESLNQNLTGVHHLEWIGDAAPFQMLDEICWAAWDFIKNRSPLKERARNLYIKKILPLKTPNLSYRGYGEYQLAENDLIEGNCFDDSVAVSRAPLCPAHSSTFTSHEKILLPNPFEIPLRSLFSKKIKNLLWAGRHISCDEFTSNCLAHPPTQSVIGSAVGYCASWCLRKKRLPHTISKPGHIESFQKELQRTNHQVHRIPLADEANLVKSGHIHASTTWNEKDLFQLNQSSGRPTQKCLVQFPVNTNQIDKVQVLIEAQPDQNFDLRLLAGSQKNCHIPGACLEVATSVAQKPGKQWLEFDLRTTISNQGWHFLEIQSEEEFRLIEGEHAPVGHISLYPNESIPGMQTTNPYCEYAVPANYSPTPHRCAIIQTYPAQKSYEVVQLKSDYTRPSHSPELWISQPTNFAYPEFIEVNWPEAINVSRIDLFFDPSFGYDSPPSPEVPTLVTPISLVKSYNIYSTSSKGKSVLIEKITHNCMSHRIHHLELTDIQSIEVEIIETHGLNRAQVFRLAVYE